MTDMFKQGDVFPVSTEFEEIVSMATDAQVRPIVGSMAEVSYVRSCESGQTLFMMSFEAMTGDTDPEEDDEQSREGIKATKIFPATVAQVQKMAKLKKKADKAAGVVAPVKTNPNAKKIEPVEDGFDPFAHMPNDFSNDF